MSYSAITTLTQDDFKALTTSSEAYYLLDFWAPWCGPCRMMAPVLEWMIDQEASQTFQIGKINTDENQEISAEFEIQGIPYFALVKFDGKGGYKKVLEIVGSQANKQAFLDKISNAVEADKTPEIV